MHLCVCRGHEGFDAYGGSYASGGVVNRFVLYAFGRLCGEAGDYSCVLIENQRALPFFAWGMSGILDAQKTIHLCWNLPGVRVGFSM